MTLTTPGRNACARAAAKIQPRTTRENRVAVGVMFPGSAKMRSALNVTQIDDCTQPAQRSARSIVFARTAPAPETTNVSDGQTA